MANIIRLTLKEIVSKRIMHAGVVLTFIYLLIYAVGLYNIVKGSASAGNQVWFMQQAGYQLLTLGWYMSTFLAGTLAILLGTGSIANEIETGTMLSLASKPYCRRSILMGKFIAYSIVTAVYSSLLVGAVTLLAAYYFKLTISLLAVITGILYFMLFPVVLVAVAHLFSSLMSTMTTGVCTFMLYTVAIVGGFMEQIGAMLKSSSLVNIGVISSLLVPSDAIYRMAVAKTGGVLGIGFISNFGPFGVSSLPSNWMLVYTFIYIIIVLILAIHFFQQKDL